MIPANTALKELGEIAKRENTLFGMKKTGIGVA
jgi:hypothetical protein